MAIFFKGSINDKPTEQPKKDNPKQLSFNELRALHAVKQEQPQETVVAKVVTKPTKPQQTDNGKLIKPKYMQDKSVYYKSSGYLKDLIGEGN